MILRRLFFLLVSLFWGLLSVQAEVPFLKRDGILRLYHSHYDDWTEVVYEREGVVQKEGIERINQFMRSRQSGKKTEMSLDLVRLLDHLQDHFGADTVEVICGYRSPDFNRFLKKEGRDVAENSFHMRGMAADIHLDEITEKKLRDYVAGLHLGGVGYYPDLLMVHVDFGPRRFWQDGSFTNRRNIGIFTDLPVTIRSDKLFYFPGEIPERSIANPEHILMPSVTTEHFFRGKWVGGAPFIAPLVYGKFRWKVGTMDGRFQYSNEFYLKRL